MKVKKNNGFNSVLLIFFIIFLFIYFSEYMGYYEYKNNEKAKMTEEQIRKYENDIKLGKNIDLEKYLNSNVNKYDNKLSQGASFLSNFIEKVVKTTVEKSFKYLSKLIDE